MSLAFDLLHGAADIVADVAQVAADTIDGMAHEAARLPDDAVDMLSCRPVGYERSDHPRTLADIVGESAHLAADVADDLAHGGVRALEALRNQLLPNLL